MPDSGLLALSLTSLIVGIMLFLYPKGLVSLSNVLSRTIAVLDAPLLRYRYVVAAIAFLGSYAFFKLALWLPLIR
ncbi:MAG: hypothetical protein HYZ91_04805 [Candidatus Omnitrophica bacterium]|nr:hypothetical protein [Candidatus Omnitrophota bacterium]